MRASRSHANDLRPVSAGKFGAGPDRRCVWHFHPRGEKACRTRHGPSDERNEGRAMSQDDRAMTDLTAEDTARENAAMWSIRLSEGDLRADGWADFEARRRQESSGGG